MVDDVDGNDSGCGRVRTVAEEGLSIDVQGHRCAARGQDPLRVAEVVDPAFIYIAGRPSLLASSYVPLANHALRINKSRPHYK